MSHLQECGLFVVINTNVSIITRNTKQEANTIPSPFGNALVNFAKVLNPYAILTATLESIIRSTSTPKQTPQMIITVRKRSSDSGFVTSVMGSRKGYNTRLGKCRMMVRSDIK